MPNKMYNVTVNLDKFLGTHPLTDIIASNMHNYCMYLDMAICFKSLKISKTVAFLRFEIYTFRNGQPDRDDERRMFVVMTYFSLGAT